MMRHDVVRVPLTRTQPQNVGQLSKDGEPPHAERETFTVASVLFGDRARCATGEADPVLEIPLGGKGCAYFNAAALRRILDVMQSKEV